MKKLYVTNEIVYIDAVHYEKGSVGYEGISRVKHTNDLNEEATKDVHIQAVIDFLADPKKHVKTKYKKKYLKADGSAVFKWVEGAEVEVIRGRYLRTDPNSNGSDNLENLPKY